MTTWLMSFSLDAQGVTCELYAYSRDDRMAHVVHEACHTLGQGTTCSVSTLRTKLVWSSSLIIPSYSVGEEMMFGLRFYPVFHDLSVVMSKVCEAQEDHGFHDGAEFTYEIPNNLSMRFLTEARPWNEIYLRDLLMHLHLVMLFNVSIDRSLREVRFLWDLEVYNSILYHGNQVLSRSALKTHWQIAVKHLNTDQVDVLLSRGISTYSRGGHLPTWVMEILNGSVKRIILPHHGPVDP